MSLNFTILSVGKITICSYYDPWQKHQKDVKKGNIESDDLPLPYDYDLWKGVADTTVSFYRTKEGIVGNTLGNVEESQGSDIFSTNSDEWSDDSEFEKLL